MEEKKPDTNPPHTIFIASLGYTGILTYIYFTSHKKKYVLGIKNILYIYKT